jgi:hypothetical protein
MMIETRRFPSPCSFLGADPGQYADLPRTSSCLAPDIAFAPGAPAGVGEIGLNDPFCLESS